MKKVEDLKLDVSHHNTDSMFKFYQDYSEYNGYTIKKALHVQVFKTRYEDKYEAEKANLIRLLTSGDEANIDIALIINNQSGMLPILAELTDGLSRNIFRAGHELAYGKWFTDVYKEMGLSLVPDNLENIDNLLDFADGVKFLRSKLERGLHRFYNSETKKEKKQCTASPNSTGR